jgi:hypothetical protein
MKSPGIVVCGPDNRDPRYRGPNGPTQEFFDQTVRNARGGRRTRQARAGRATAPS